VWNHPAAQPVAVFVGLVVGCLVAWLVLTHLPDPGPCGYFDQCVEGPGRV
jgi:hypothetical protein